MAKSKDIQKEIKEAADLRAKIKADIKAYNKLAKKIDANNRLALLSASIYKEDYLYDLEYEAKDADNDEDQKEAIKQLEAAKKMNHEKFLKEIMEYNIGADISTLGADGWFPSSICPGF